MERSQMSTATVQDSTCTSRSSGRGLFHELKTHRKHNIYIYLSSASTSLSGLFPPPCRTPNGLKLFRKLLGSAKIDHSTAVPACFAWCLSFPALSWCSCQMIYFCWPRKLLPESEITEVVVLFYIPSSCIMYLSESYLFHQQNGSKLPTPVKWLLNKSAIFWMYTLLLGLTFHR